jgi:predicted ATPase
MKVQSLHLRNFKRFHIKELDFRDPETGSAEDLIVLVGQNGSGKSSILQAISAILGAAKDRLPSPADLEWPGFDLHRANEAWARPIAVEVSVEFSQDEIEATREYFDRTKMGQNADKVAPAHSSPLTLGYNPDLDRVEAPTAAEFFQLQGKKYAPEGTQLFERVGEVFWYTEHRTTNSLTPVMSNGESIRYDMDLLRRRMSDFFLFHERVRRGEHKLRPGQRDIFDDIERAYRTIFPTHKFEGPVPRAEIDEILAEPWFYLFDGSHQYELGEMSGGERAIFPLIFDFANWGIHNSVVLIDELELHLHPPLQQGLLKALRNLGHNNQFIITTHSDAVEAIVPPESLRRL